MEWPPRQIGEYEENSRTHRRWNDYYGRSSALLLGRAREAKEATDDRTRRARNKNVNSPKPFVYYGWM